MKALYDVAWKVYDRAILDCLRRSPEPIHVSQIAVRAGVSHQIEYAEVMESLGRLEEAGSIRRTTVDECVEPYPMASFRCQLAYEAAGGWGGGR